MISRSRILIADDHNLIAELFQQLLARDFDVVGTVGDGRALVRAAVELRPDLILVDIATPLLNGLDAGRQVKELLPTVKLVYMTLTADADVAAEAFELGASGYLLKTCAASELTLAVHEVLRGRTYLSKAISRDTIDSLRWEHKKLLDVSLRLSKRQREVLQLVAEGKVMKDKTASSPGHESPDGLLSQVRNPEENWRDQRRRTGQVCRQKPHRGRLKPRRTH